MNQVTALAEQNQLIKLVKNEVPCKPRHNTGKLQKLVSDYSQTLQHATTAAPTTLSLPQPASPFVPTSPSPNDSDSSDEGTSIMTPTEEENKKSTLLDEMERINCALQQTIKGMEDQLSSSAALSQQKAISGLLSNPSTAINQPIKHIEDMEARPRLVWPEITSFKDALEFRYVDESSSSTRVASLGSAGLLQYFYEKSPQPQATTSNPPCHKPKFFAILRGPGSGKSTICSSWAKVDSSVIHIAIGDILRAEAQRPNSPYVQVLKANLAKGAIGDPQMTVGLIKNHVITRLRSTTVPIRTYLLDGFSRAKQSAEYFEKTIAPISKIIFLDIPETTMIERCLQLSHGQYPQSSVRVARLSRASTLGISLGMAGGLRPQHLPRPDFCHRDYLPELPLSSPG